MAASMQYMRSEESASDGSEDVLLASFRNGRLIVPDGNTNTTVHSPEFTAYKNVHTSDSRKKNRRTLVAESNGLQYVGQNYGAEASRANSACKYLVGVLDKKTNKMKVYDAQYMQMKPWLQKTSDVAADETDNAEKTYAEKQDALTQAFGSVRKQHAAESRRKSRVGTEALDKSAKTAVKLAKSQPSTPIKETMSSEGIIPPCNREATVVHDVYKLDEILTPHLRQCIKKPATKFCKAKATQLTEWHTKKTYSPFILEHVKNLVHATSEFKNRNAAIILYIHYLSMMYKLKASDLQKIPFEADTPEAIKRHLIENFTQTSLVGDGNRERRVLPKRMKDKILSHALVLALILDDYKTSLTSLQRTLVTAIKVLQTHARALGCSVSNVKSTPAKKDKNKDEDTPTTSGPQPAQCIATLSLPLKVARVFRKRGGSNR